MTHRRLPHRAALVAAMTATVPALVARVVRAVAVALVCALALLPAAAHALALRSPAPTLSLEGAPIARALAELHLGDSESVDAGHAPRVDARGRMDTGGNAGPGATGAPGIVQGHLYDPLSGLYHFGAREYVPEIGQFARPEPLVVDVTRPVTAVPYAYAGGDPVNFEDRDGRVRVLREFSAKYGGLVAEARAANADLQAGGRANFLNGAFVALAAFGVRSVDFVNGVANAAVVLGRLNGVMPKESADYVAQELLPVFDWAQTSTPGSLFWDAMSLVAAAPEVTSAGAAEVASAGAGFVGGDPRGSAAFGFLATSGAIELVEPGPGGRVAGAIREVRAATVVRKVAEGFAGVSRPSSRALARALEAAGQVRPLNSAAHHIVAGRAPIAAQARAVLQRFGIDINDAANGVFLPSTRAAPSPTGAAVHSTLHTRAYYDTVNEMLGAATTRSEAEAALSAIRDALLSGGL